MTKARTGRMVVIIVRVAKTEVGGGWGCIDLGMTQSRRTNYLGCGWREDRRDEDLFVVWWKKFRRIGPHANFSQFRNLTGAVISTKKKKTIII
jgi:hypothetical protein